MTGRELTNSITLHTLSRSHHEGDYSLLVLFDTLLSSNTKEPPRPAQTQTQTATDQTSADPSDSPRPQSQTQTSEEKNQNPAATATLMLNVKFNAT